jgi:hypothetical protein
MTGDDLFKIERNFWTGDAEFYRSNLDEKCLVVFTEMSGLKARNDQERPPLAETADRRQEFPFTLR